MQQTTTTTLIPALGTLSERWRAALSDAAQECNNSGAPAGSPVLGVQLKLRGPVLAKFGDYKGQWIDEVKYRPLISAYYDNFNDHCTFKVGFLNPTCGLSSHTQWKPTAEVAKHARRFQNFIHMPMRVSLYLLGDHDRENSSIALPWLTQFYTELATVWPKEQRAIEQVLGWLKAAEEQERAQ